MALNVSDLVKWSSFFYFIGNNTMIYNHSQSETWCEGHGGHLSSAHSSHEIEFVKSKTSGQVWIGLFTSKGCDDCKGHFNDFLPSCKECRKDWEWTDGSNFDEYQNWEEDKPNNKNNKCVTLIDSGKWRNAECTDERQFICKFQDLEEMCDGNGECENGTCTVATTNSTVCKCSSGYTGELCNIDVDECEDIWGSCGLNSNDCTNTVGGYECICKEGWTGTTCNDDINECSFNPCLHDVNCTNTEGAYTCFCEEGYTSLNCDQDVDECKDTLNACGVNSNGCTNTVGGFDCICKDGWNGTRCHEDIDECLSDPCVHHINCTNTLGSYCCLCEEGYTSLNCDQDIDECKDAEAYCGTGFTCTNLEGSYNCSNDTTPNFVTEHYNKNLWIAFYICLAITIMIYVVFIAMVVVFTLRRRNDHKHTPKPVGVMLQQQETSKPPENEFQENEEQGNEYQENEEQGNDD